MAFAGIVIFLVTKIGWTPGWYLIFLGPIAAVVMGIAVFKQKTWAMRLSGIVVLILGIGSTGFFLFDFLRSIITRNSYLGYEIGENISGGTYGSYMCFFTILGLGLIAGGLALLEKKTQINI